MEMKRKEITEKQLAEIKEARRKNQNKKAEKRLQVLEMQAVGKKQKEIQEATGFSRSYINAIVKKYQEKGLSAIVETRYPGNRRNLSYEEEEALLEPFKAEAEAGHIVEISRIKAAYVEKVGHSIGNGQIYYVLKRHGWRKVMPRSQHPQKASDEAIEASKKLRVRQGFWLPV